MPKTLMKTDLSIRFYVGIFRVRNTSHTPGNADRANGEYAKSADTLCHLWQQSISEALPQEKLKGALIYKGTMFTSMYIENQGNGNFGFRSLPTQAQVSPLFGISVTDFNDDGNLDILGVGNSYSTEPLTGYYDAGIGVCLQGDGSGKFTTVPVTQSGFFVDRDAKGLAAINLGQQKSAWIATANRDSVRMFEQTAQQNFSVLKILPDDVYAEIIFTNGKKRKHEFYYGSSYLSQSSRECF